MNIAKGVLLGSLAAMSLVTGVATAQNLTPGFNLGPYQAAVDQFAADHVNHMSGRPRSDSFDDGLTRNGNADSRPGPDAGHSKW
jgi:hypothetical protein